MDSQKNAAAKSSGLLRHVGNPLTIIALCLVSNGCTMEPREGTAVGAAAGGVLGAGLGAIVGAQTGDPTTGLIVGGLAGSAAGASIGNGIDANQIAAEEQNELIKRQEAELQAHRKQIAELKQSRDQGQSGYDEPAYPYVDSPRSAVRADGRSQQSYNGSNSRGSLQERTLAANQEEGPDSEMSQSGAFGRGVSKGTTGLDRDAQQVREYTQQSRVFQNSGHNSHAESYERSQHANLRTNEGGASRHLESLRQSDTRHVHGDSPRGADRQVSALAPESTSESITSPWKTVPEQNAQKVHEEDGGKPHLKKHGAEKSPRKNSPEADPLVGAAGTGVQVGSSSSGESGCDEAARWASRINPSDEKTDNLFKLRKAVILCPSEPKYHISLGDTFLAMKRVGDAEREYKEAVALEPQNDEAREKLNGLKNG